MDVIQKKIRLLEEERLKLSSKIEGLVAERNQALLDVLNALPAGHLDIYTLVGGLLEVIEKAETHHDQAEVWLQAGQKFCRNVSAQKSAKIKSLAKKAPPDDPKEN